MEQGPDTITGQSSIWLLQGAHDFNEPRVHKPTPALHALGHTHTKPTQFKSAEECFPSTSKAQTEAGSGCHNGWVWVPWREGPDTITGESDHHRELVTLASSGS